MMREYRPMAAPFAGREAAEPPTHVPFGRRIVRSEGNAQKSMTAPENGRPPKSQKRQMLPSDGVARMTVLWQ